MNVRKIRAKTGLSKKEFLRKIRPSFDKRKWPITETMLDALEGGAELEETRMKIIRECIEETFPEYGNLAAAVQRKKIWLCLRSPHVALAGFVLVSMIACVLYFLISDKELVLDMLTVLASVSGVFALIYAIYKIVS